MDQPDLESANDNIEETSGRTYSIGRLDTNDIVLVRPMVSGHHANLIDQDGNYFIEDAGSTNGTAIGQQDNFVERAEVSEQDLVFFGSFSIKVTHLLAMANRKSQPEAATTSAITHVHVGQEAKVSFTKGIVIAGAAIAMLIVGIIVVSYLKPDSDSVVDTSASKSLDSNARGQGKEQKLTEAPLLAPLGKGDFQAALPTQAADKLFAVVVGNVDQSSGRRIGTAWLVGRKHLLTTARTILAIEQFTSDRDQSVFAVQASTGAIEEVIHNELDARFSVSSREFNADRRTYENLRQEAETLKSKDPSSARLQEIKQIAQGIVRRGLEQRWIQQTQDVGRLTLANELTDVRPAQLNVSVDHATGSRFHLHAIPFSTNESDWLPTVDLQPQGISLRLVEVPSPPESIASNDISQDRPGKWIVSASPDGFDSKELAGSPIVDRTGQVIGMVAKSLRSSVSDEPEQQTRLMFEAIPAANLVASLSNFE